MNVYDFDGTIYRGDSTIDFWLFCFHRHPAILKTVPELLLSGIRYKFFCGSLEKFKSVFFHFLPSIPNLEAEVTAFWDKHYCNLYTWYLNQKQETDVIVSASPEFLLKECCARLGVKLIGTQIDEQTGTLIGKNCKGEEKVRRFRLYFPDDTIHNFYSDTYSDMPMAIEAQQCFLVKQGKILPWRFKTN